MWPDNKKCAVLLTFDFDAESLWVSKNLNTPSSLSRGEYGARVGAPRILDLLKKYGIPATFFVPADTARRHPDVVQSMVNDGHEIGHHGDVHESPVNLSLREEKRILLEGIETLEKVTGKRPVGYRSPAWDLSPNSINLLIEHGFLYDSSMMADDFQPYLAIDNGQTTPLVEIPVSYELDDAAFFYFTFKPVYYTGMADPAKVLDIWATEFDGAFEHGGIFVLTMHPQISGRYHRVKMLAGLIDHMLEYGAENLWFATCSEAAEHWRSIQTA